MENIALAFSGGGFRAAAFSLGALSYLNEVEIDGKRLIQNVKFIGSTSGGSLTNIFYSLSVARGGGFLPTYQKALQVMNGEDLISNVFKILKSKEKWNGRDDKSRNLINGFSIAYDELFGHATFKHLYEPAPGVIPHLEDVCVNATEFTNGLSFRFQSQNKHLPSGRIGNYYIYFNDPDVGGQLLLGDIMACSSCFSGGFEPVIFPDDFGYGALTREHLGRSISLKANPFTIKDPSRDLLSSEEFKKVPGRFGLMDGGVADNQAIDSVFKSNARRKSVGKGFDLVIVTDVGSYFVDGYTLPMEKRNWYNNFTLQQVVNGIKILGLAFVGILAWVLLKNWAEWMKYVIVLPGLSLAAYLAGAFYLNREKRKAFKEKSTWLVVLFSYVNYFLTIRYSRIKQMATSRLKSVFLLADDLYLKQIRRLYYEKIYSDAELRTITVSNAIYDLSLAKQHADQDQGLPDELSYGSTKGNEPAEIQPPPGHYLIMIAEQARLMPTTLWFDQFQKEAGCLKAIVGAGQFTTCYNLLKYYTKKTDLTASEQRLKEILTADWKKFNAQPFYLYDQLEQQGQSKP
jgi:predicted acylesterase/phospholipase RssA